jgi:hypothetical protein
MSFTLQEDEPGKYTVQLGELSTDFVVVKPRSIKVSLSSIEIGQPVKVTAGASRQLYIKNHILHYAKNYRSFYSMTAFCLLSACQFSIIACFLELSSDFMLLACLRTVSGIRLVKLLVTPRALSHDRPHDSLGDLRVRRCTMTTPRPVNWQTASENRPLNWPNSSLVSRDSVQKEGGLSLKTRTLMMMLGDALLGHGDVREGGCFTETHPCDKMWNVPVLRLRAGTLAVVALPEC